MKKIALYGLFLMGCFGCATAPINRFHTGKVIDSGHVELGVAAEFVRDVAGSYFKDSKLDYGSQIVLPNAEVFGRVGLWSPWELGIRAVMFMGNSISIDNRFQIHHDVWDFPDTTLGVMYSYSKSEHTILSGPEEEYRTHALDFPVTFSRELSTWFTLYGGPMYSVYFYDTTSATNPDDGTTHSGTLFGGAAFKVWYFRFMTEIAVTSITKQAGIDKGDTGFFFFPGLAIALDI